METVWITLLRRTPASSPSSICAGCCQQGHAGSKTQHQQNPPVLNWRCRLTQVDLYSGRERVMVMVYVSRKWLCRQCFAVCSDYVKLRNALFFYEKYGDYRCAFRVKQVCTVIVIQNTMFVWYCFVVTDQLILIKAICSVFCCPIWALLLYCTPVHLLILLILAL